MFNEHIQTFDVYCTWIINKFHHPLLYFIVNGRIMKLTIEVSHLIDKMMLICTCQIFGIIAFDFDDPYIFPIILNNFILNNDFENLTFNSICVIPAMTLCACNLSINVYKNNVG